MIQKNKMYYITAIVLLMNLLGCPRSADNKLTPKELTVSGYRYVVFGSQRTGGIELFDLQDSQFHSLILTRDINRQQYVMPVIAANGKGFCIKQEHAFKSKNKTSEILTFDLNTLSHRSTDVKIRQPYANLALSSDGDKLAFVFMSDSNKPSLGLFNIGKQKIENIATIDQRFADNPVKVIWEPDNLTVVIWDTITDLPAIRVIITTKQVIGLDTYPLDFKNNVGLFMDKALKSYYLLESQKQKQVIDINHVTAHSFKMTRDGKFLLYGWLKGKGFETLAIRKIGTDREYQIALDNHPSTVLGLDIW